MVPVSEQGLRGVPQVSSKGMMVSIKMKTTKNMMVAALLALAVLSVGITPIFAAPNNEMSRGVKGSEKGAQNKNMFTSVQARGQTIREQIRERLQAMNQPIDINSLDETTIDTVFAQVEAADPVDNSTGSVIWYLNARGISTPMDVSTATNATLPVGVQLLAEKVKTTEYGTLYKVLWARVNHDGEKVDVRGYAVLDSNRVFYLKLKGDNMTFKSIGMIAPAGIGVRAAIKGYMTHDGSDYSFQVHGRAIPLRGNLIRNRLGQMNQS